MADQKRHWVHTVNWKNLGKSEPGTLSEMIELMNGWVKAIADDSRNRYVCGQVEKCPTTDRLHGQMYTEWKQSLRLSELVKAAPSHAEARKGTRTDAKNYATLSVYKGKDKGQMASLPAFGEWRVDKEGETEMTQKERAIHYIVEDGLTPTEIAFRYPLVYFTHSHNIQRLYNARNDYSLSGGE